ncbi:MAG: signal peptidase II [Fibrobacterota bacterium]|nr:signal peptidase II [Fibrobacterota bacterium]QQS07323.1 MAG: signal peptidase II [Fibrobacterota bacterium]
MSERRNGLLAATIVGGIALDQASKILAERWLLPTDLHTYLGGIFRIQMVRNRGAFLSLGATLPEHLRQTLLIWGVGLFLVGLTVWIFRSKSATPTSRWCMAAVASGGLANLIDRIRFDGGVLDFLNVGIGGLRTGIFNIADMYITFAVIWLLVDSFRTKKPQHS